MPKGHPWCADPVQIVENHTLVPVYAAFCADEERMAIVQAVALGKTANPAASLGLTTTEAYDAKTYKFCRKCILEDWANGFPVSYREHQASFVRVCAKHKDPLVYGCEVCFARMNSAGRWEMAGECGCSGAFFRWDALDSTEQGSSSWLWMAQQVRWLCRSRPSSQVGAAKVLHQRLAQTFGYGGGIRPRLVHDGLVEVFGTAFLSAIGLGPPSTSTQSSWPSRLFTSGRKPVNLIKLLALTRLVCKDVSSLFTTTPQVMLPEVPRSAVGYSLARDKRMVRDKSTLEAALQRCNFRLSVAARALGTNSFVLAAELAAARIRVPLSSAQVARLGVECIQDVQCGFRAGDQKIVIRRRHGLSEWSLLLIELDEPGLADAHRQAVVDRQRAVHRKTLSEWLSAQPSATRAEIAANLPTSLEWLRDFDQEWLAATLPEKKTGTICAAVPRSSRKDWGLRDEVFERDLRDRVQEFGRMELKPVHRTKSFLLKELGLLDYQLSKLPATTKAMDEFVETRDAFLMRRLEWAMREYAKLKVPLSMNRFRRVAALPATTIEQHVDVVKTLARRVGVSVSARSMFVYSSDNVCVDP